MTNKEFYQSVFSQVHPAAPVTWESCRARSRRARRPRRLLMAAAVAAVLLALSCAAVAVNFLGIRDLLLFPDREGAGDTAFQRVSLSGYMDTPESQALAQWQAFLDSYDPDGSIRLSVGCTPNPQFDRYIDYGVYTQEMADTLESIAAQYGLKLHTAQYNLAAHPELLESCAGFLGTTTGTPTYMYEDGTFHVDAGQALLSSFGPLDFQLQRSVRGSLHHAQLSIDPADYQEWDYKTAEGLPVHLALGTGRSLVLADLEDCFVFVTVLEGADGGLTRADLEEFANCFAFSKLTPVVPPEALAGEDGNPATVNPPAGEYTDAARAYATVLRSLLYGGYLPDGTQAESLSDDPLSAMAFNQFAVQDLDGDGTAELILLYTTSYTAGQQGYILSFDPAYTGSGTPVTIRLEEFPSFSLYDNGAVMARASHNQSWGELWPYVLYLWEEGAYRPVAAVYSADRETLESAGLADQWPDGVDTSGTGTVYYVTPSGEDGVTRAMDMTEYEAWWEETMGQAQPLEPVYWSLTEENIAAALGVEVCPAG